MRHSQLFAPTIKEDPSDAQVISHKLMLRAGMIRKVAAGIYNYLPLGWRTVQKVANIVREEMNRAGAQEINMPVVLPSELWKESGRWDVMGPEMLRLKDRKEAEFCLGPTHEEVVTAIVRDHVRSYRQLPLNLYQIQTKFRDETRPRFGLMRAREFIMKDAYSFGMTEHDANAAYESMVVAYQRIFTRCGLNFRMVEADTGNIGGKRSQEFQVLAESGEDLIASCDSCGYAANVELAEIRSVENALDDSKQLVPYEEVYTPNKQTIEEVSDYLGVLPNQTIKALLLMVDDKPLMALCRGDHELNEIKLRRALGASQARFMTDAEALEYGETIGYVGPINCRKDMRIVADNALKNATAMICGAKKDYHFVQVSYPRDFSAEFFDLRKASVGDTCGRCGSSFGLHRGIEVGHVFYLGKKYSQAMNARASNEDGVDQILEMGTYGIGVGRTAAAAIEQCNDEKGISWPISIAPFEVSLLRLGDDTQLAAYADTIYGQLLERGVEVLYDDRDERPGIKFNEADLIGCPLRINLGKKSFDLGEAELVERSSGAMAKISLDKLVECVVEKIHAMKRNISVKVQNI